MSIRSGRRILGVVALSLMLAAMPAAATELPDGVSADWWSEVQRSIELEEYGIVADGVDGAAFRAGNPAQRFEARFDASGVRLAPLDGSSWEWGLTLTGWGRPDDLLDQRVVDLRVDGERIELDRGALVEWFVNAPEGLEHGFTVPARPHGAGERVVFDLAFAGGLHPVFAEDGQAVDLYSTDNVAVLRYGKLLAIDAAGDDLPARLEPIPGGVRIAVEDGLAVYPLTIDPLATSAAWTALGQGTGNYFGYSLVTAGDVNGDGYSDVLVGAYGNTSSTGRAYLYLGTASGPSVTASWTKSGEVSGSQFGASVATAGDVNGDGYSDVIIGAKNHNNATGKVYVYLGSPTGLSATASWTAVGAAANNYFGDSVSAAGDVNGDGYSDVIVGAYGYFGSEGKAYVYHGGASGLAATASWSAAGEGSGNWFADAVSTAGDVNGDGYSDVVIGAYGNATNTGKVYVYLGGASGLAGAPAWTAVGEVANGYFGSTVAAAGDVNGDGYSDILIGAPNHDTDPLVDLFVGKAYLYRGTSTGLSATASWTAVGEGTGHYFGSSVATAGDVNADGYSDVFVGAYGSATNAGKAYVYLGTSTGLSTATAWTKTGETTNNYFGAAVATGGDTNGDGFSDIVVGAYGNATNTGKAYVFVGGANGLAATEWWSKSGEASNDTFGFSLGTAGDVNGDGYSDVIVGATGAASGDGRAYVFHGRATGLSTTPSWTVQGDGGSFAWSLGTAGDVNGDGYSDVIIGNPDEDYGQGRAWVYHGGPSGLSTTAAWMVVGETRPDKFGYSVSTAGDVNRDGYSDVLVGAYFYSAVDDGKAYLYLGGPAGLSEAPAWTAVGQDSYLGNSLSTAGDVNGDGYSDVIIGAYADASATGKVYVYHGGPSGLPASASWTKTGESLYGSFGWAVSTAGDVNGDGYADVVIGAYNVSGTRGKAYLFLGGPSGLATSASWAVLGEYGGDAFGYGVASAGDVNGDGYSDVVIGAQSYPSRGDQGKAYFYFGGASGLSAAASWTAIGSGGGVFFAHAVASAGDVNGDGFSDVVASASRNSGGVGKVYLYPGGADRGGAAFVPRQLRGDLSAPIGLGGAAYDQQFALRLTLRSPVGRVGRKLQWQVSYLGSGFAPGVSPIQEGPIWSEDPVIGAAVVDLDQPDREYVWRARVRYDPVESPFVPWSRWFTMAGNDLYEADLYASSTAPCAFPDQELYIGTAGLDGGDLPVLTCSDPNSPVVVTGYNVYRAPAAMGPWTKIAANVTDSDPGVSGIQFVDPNGGGSATWFYRVAAFNGGCGVEGPW